MKKFLKQAGKFFCGALLIGALGINSVSAAENPDAMQAFREAVTNSADANRILHEDIYFVVPTVQSELDFIGKRDGENFKMQVTLVSGRLTKAAIILNCKCLSM